MVQAEPETLVQLKAKQDDLMDDEVNNEWQGWLVWRCMTKW